MSLIHRAIRIFELPQSETPMRTSVRLARSGAVVVAVVLGLAAVPAHAVSCFGFSCAGHDPVVYNCSVTSTTTATAFSGSTAMATLWNRFSSNCKSNWGRAQLTPAALNLGYKAYVTISTQHDSHNFFESMCFPGPDNTGALTEGCIGYATGGFGGSSVFWSDMVDGTNLATAVVEVFDASGHSIATAAVSQ